ncbi:MAG TPA: peptide-methionine (R)-S-oxide reductase MsrB [Casimicrobiaceae bacterium]|nr:peptide-methionine (R)-S-oxide reductase MsrB [Casimicrobiaceae bacterium]
MERREFLLTLAALAATRTAFAATDKTPVSIDELRKNWQTLLAKNADVTLSTEPLDRSNAVWRQLLTPAQYHVLREEGTEYPGSSPLNNEKRAGVFVCAGCSLPLFTSKMKYDSGTGWPSFFTSIPDHLASKKDYKIIVERDEYHCVRCGGHQGHVFDDGPAPTRQRWCNNGVALRFIPA